MPELIDHVFAAKLVKQAQSGDRDAFAELYAMTYRGQYSKAYHYLKDEYLAQDALQDVYVLALKNLQKLDQPKAFVAWLGQINFRVCYNMLLKRKQERSIDEMEENRTLSDYYVSPDSPEENTIRRNESQRLLHAVQSLPSIDRQIVELRYSEDKKLTEIAAITGMGLSSVKRHIQSACTKLEKMMEGE